MPKTIPAMLEPASPNIVAVAGMEAALDEIIGRISDFEAKEKELTENLDAMLESKCLHGDSMPCKRTRKNRKRNYIFSIGRFTYRNCSL